MISQLQIHDDLLTIADDPGTPLLEHCFGRATLSNGAFFATDAIERTAKTEDDGSITVETIGNDILPGMVWRARKLPSGAIEVILSITNTTPKALPIERLDVLTTNHGYRRQAAEKLSFRRTGWQTFSPAAVSAPFTSYDPWLQPPMYMPGVPPLLGDGHQLAWMTVLKADDMQPLLIGFGSAINYSGMISLESRHEGHSITASNYPEGIELAPGETLSSEPLVIAWHDSEDTLLDLYGDYVGKAMQARIPKAIPTGWSHWLYYFADVTEQDILENIQQIKEKNLPLEYIQIDDGYQTYFGDWLSINDKFPRGMKFLADEIRKAGRKPGIWLSPFMADARSQVVAQHPEWFIHDAQGKLLDVNRHGDEYWAGPNYGLDLTHPEAYEWVRKVITTVCHEWGYEYLKVDFLYAGAVRGVRHDSTVTSVQAYRKGMALIREIAGDYHILGCGTPLLSSVGIVDSMRIGPDLSWEGDMPGGRKIRQYTKPWSRDPLSSLLSHQWMHKKLWVNDADYVRLRQNHINLDWPQLQALTTLITLGGGAMYDSDKLIDLEPAGYDLLARLLPVADIDTLPLDSNEPKPSRFMASVQRGDGNWRIAAQFNWQDKPQACVFSPGNWQLPAGQYHIYDLLNDRYIGLETSHDFGMLAQHNAALFSLCPDGPTPQLIATKGHLLGPAGDIQVSVWREGTLHVELVNGPRSDAIIWVSIPDGYEIRSISNGEEVGRNGPAAAIRPSAPLCDITYVRL